MHSRDSFFRETNDMSRKPAATVSMAEFKRQGARILRRLKRTRRPLVLTLEGEPAFVLQTTEDFRRHFEEIERTEAIAGIRRGLDSMEAGGGVPADEAFAILEERLPYLRRP